MFNPVFFQFFSFFSPLKKYREKYWIIKSEAGSAGAAGRATWKFFISGGAAELKKQELKGKIPLKGFNTGVFCFTGFKCGVFVAF